MSIMDFFRPSAPAQAPAAPTAAPATAPTPNDPAAKNPNDPINPMDAYATLFKKSENPDVPPSLTLDPKVLSDVSNQMDFTNGVAPDMLQKALQGDAQSLMDVMQAVGRNAYKASLSHQSALTDKFVGARTEHAMKGIGAQVKSEMTNNALSATPNYQHPVVKEQLNQLARQFSGQHPDATPAQVADMAVKYMQDLAAAISPPTQAQAATEAAKAGEVDWDKYFQTQQQ